LFIGEDGSIGNLKVSRVPDKSFKKVKPPYYFFYCPKMKVVNIKEKRDKSSLFYSYHPLNWQ